MRRFVYVLFFLAFTTEDTTMFAGLWKTHMGYVDDFFFQPSPLKLPFFFWTSLVMVFVASSSNAGRTLRAQPIDRALWGAFITLIVFILYGAMTGGKPWMAGWQLFPWINAFVFAKLLLATMRTPAHFHTLGKVFIAAAVYRAVIGITFYLFFVRGVTFEVEPPAHITTHGDTVLFVGAIVVLVANAIVRRSRSAILWAIGLSLLMLVIIQLNNRRLAFASLAFSLIVIYLLLPAGKVRRRINIALLALSPIIAVYVAVGWGRKEKIFKPLASFQSMTVKEDPNSTGETKEDSSTLARNAENAGLHATLVKGGVVTGTGWGQEYVEVDSRFSIDGIYKEWRYVPHNSMFGILAFSGMLGFMGLWMPLPVGAYLNARTWRTARDPTERTAALAALAHVIVCANQTFGDMGLQSQPTLFLAAAGYAAAGRLSVTSGAWPGKPLPRAPAAAPTAPPAPEPAAGAEGPIRRPWGDPGAPGGRV